MALPDVLRQLAQISPGIVAGLKGDGNAMKAFMDAYQRTNAELDDKERLQQQTTMQGEDRQRTIARQGVMDTERQTDRARQATVQGQEDSLRSLRVVPELAQAGGQMDSPESAKMLIESLMPKLLEGFGPNAMAYGQPAVEMATQTITGRQKSQMKQFVDAALKTSYVADNPDSDPELVDLPAHIVKIVGKPTARLSELQQFAELPVGKPQGKERMPAAAGSMEEFSDPNITPERKAAILADRKAYMQSDDRAPRVTVNTGGIDKNAALKFQDDYARDSKPYIQLRDAYQRVKAAKPDAAGDLSLIFAYMKILDPNSVVREQEFANAQNAAGVPDQVRNLYNKAKEGVRLNPEQRKQFLSQAEALFENARTNQRQVRGTYSNRAKQWGIPENMVLDEDPLMATSPAPAGVKTAAALGERRTIQGQLAEWDGKGWKPVQQ